MKNTNLKISLAGLALLATALLAPHAAWAHCDGLDGPVVKAAQRALAENNVNLAIIWVQKDNEPEIKRVFEKTLAVRKLGPEAKELADLYFFETLVRLHRAGEGAPYTGLKPAGRDLGPAIPAGDKALETGEIEPVLHLLSAEMKHGLHERFTEALAKKKFAKDDVEAGRAYIKAYVTLHPLRRRRASGGKRGRPRASRRGKGSTSLSGRAQRETVTKSEPGTTQDHPRPASRTQPIGAIAAGAASKGNASNKRPVFAKLRKAIWP